MTGSVVASIMLQKIIEKYSLYQQQEFIFFDKPFTHVNYHTGRSWKEEAGLSLDDIKYGLNYIGSKITPKHPKEEFLQHTKPFFDTKGKLVNSCYLVLYTFSGSYCKKYDLNEELLNSSILCYLDDSWKKNLYIPGISNTQTDNFTNEV